MKTLCALAAVVAIFAVPLGAAAETAPTPTPPASPAPTAAPPVSWQVNLSGYTFRTHGVNASGAVDTADGSDAGSRTDYSGVLVSFARASGVFRYGAVAGGYAFPVVGQPLNPTFKPGVNTDTYGVVPVAYVQYVPNGTWTFTAGKMATLIGQENVFTFQNANVQRGLGWSQETTISRGVRATYTSGKFTGNLEYNDGFYSGRLNALEGAVQWTLSPNSQAAFAFVVPPPNAPPNPTAGIANKRIGALMATQHAGKLVLAPYLQWIDSPANAALGYTGDERAFAAIAIAQYAFDDAWSLGARYESLVNRSSPVDGAANADLIGFGPGSTATTFTLTPAFKTGHVTLRAEFSRVTLGTFAPGLGFGPGGTQSSQTRAGFEAGAQF